MPSTEAKVHPTAKSRTLRAQSITLGDDGIVRVRLNPRSEIGLEDARDSIRAIRELNQGSRRPVLVDFSGIRSMDREARQYYAGPETASCNSAAALLITSPLTRAIGNFFLGLNKPIAPTRLFTDEDAAITWLKEQRT